MLALAFAVLLLAQAGAPFTTGLWAKVQVVFAVIDVGDVPLAVIAMVTAAVAAYFYLPRGRADVRRRRAGRARGRDIRLGRAVVGRHGGGRPDNGGHARRGRRLGQRLRGRARVATPAAATGAVTTLNEQILLADEEGLDEAEAPEAVPVPALTGLATAL